MERAGVEWPRLRLSTWATLLAGLASIPEGTAGPVSYDIVYVRWPRAGDDTLVMLPQGEDPYRVAPGADLVLLRGRESVLPTSVVGSSSHYCVPVVFQFSTHCRTIVVACRRAIVLQRRIAAQYCRAAPTELFWVIIFDVYFLFVVWFS